jgi:signal transduction histidine kinase/PAS domain-containing protein
MASVESELGLLRDPRLAVLATSAWPAWLWSVDASRMLWANAVGAALFGASNVGECVEKHIDVNKQVAGQIIRLSGTLPPGGAARLERLRGFGAGFGRALTCACSRIALAGSTPAVLVAATEPAGPTLSLAERARRIFFDDRQRLAVFAPDGSFVHATGAARALLGGVTSLLALGIAAPAVQALANGGAYGTIVSEGINLDVLIERLGDGASRVLVLTLAPESALAPTQVAELAQLEPLAEATPPPAVVPPVTANEPIATQPPAAAEIGKSADEPGVAEPPVSQSQVEVIREPLTERRHPLRFVWQMDADGRFIVASDEFVDLVGPRTMSAFGRKWSDIAAELNLDQDNQLARAIATHETWSGIIVPWPVDGTSERMPVELSGLPVFDRDRSFRGYRGFGVCRDIGRINQLLRIRREQPSSFMQTPESHATAADPKAESVPANTKASEKPSENVSRHTERPALSIAPAANVVLFRQAPSQEPKPPALSAGERKAFRELAQELTARLRGTPEAPATSDNAVALVQETEKPGEISSLVPSETEIAHASPPTRELTGNEAGVVSAATPVIDPSLLDRIPIGVLIYRHDELIYANRHFLEWTGYDSLNALAEAGGLNSLFVEAAADVFSDSANTQSLSIMTRQGDTLPVDGRLFTVPWNGASALALVLTNGATAERRRATENALAAAQTELRDAKRETQRAAAAKAEFLGKVSHEFRTPLNAITGFAEIMMSERFGPIGNERYTEYLKDIQAAGAHLVSLLNDMVDLSKVETGKLETTFVDVSLNDLTHQCVGVMQPQANRARIIIRTSITPGLPRIVADERSLRQIVINLLANAINFTGPGGQVIVSTAITDSREVVLRVRDTGVGMTEKDIQAALEPFRQSATSGSWGSGGTSLGLPLTKALAEANHANFSIKSAPNAGTLVEIAFPHGRVAVN